VKDAWQFVLLCVPSVFIIVDPPGAIPVFLAMTARDTLAVQRRMAARACLVAGGVLLAFALSGQVLFNLFGITIEALRIAGGFILFRMGSHMLAAETSPQRQTPEEVEEGVQKEDVAITPLAIPILAGPGAIATVITLGTQARGPLQMAALAASVVATMGVAFVLLSNSHRVQARLGETGQRILSRIMGLILCTIAVQFVLDGARDALPALLQSVPRG
jgi:multiple antibiotic resistance protein